MVPIGLLALVKIRLIEYLDPDEKETTMIANYYYRNENEWYR